MQKFILLLFILSLFFILGTATSKLETRIEYDCIVRHEGTNIFLTSQSPVDIRSASMILSRITAQDEVESFFRNGYDLEGLSSDTLPVNSFISFIDTMPFPLNENPSNFSLEFFSLDTAFFKIQIF